MSRYAITAEMEGDIYNLYVHFPPIQHRKTELGIEPKTELQCNADCSTSELPSLIYNDTSKHALKFMHNLDFFNTLLFHRM